MQAYFTELQFHWAFCMNLLGSAAVCVSLVYPPFPDNKCHDSRLDAEPKLLENTVAHYQQAYQLNED